MNERWRNPPVGKYLCYVFTIPDGTKQGNTTFSLPLLYVPAEYAIPNIQNVRRKYNRIHFRLAPV
jgi:hypothetical protein